jgi:hypothetical protein
VGRFEALVVLCRRKLGSRLHYLLRLDGKLLQVHANLGYRSWLSWQDNPAVRQGLDKTKSVPVGPV